MQEEEQQKYTERIRKRAYMVEKDLKASMDCEVYYMVDLSTDIPWKIEDMENKD